MATQTGSYDFKAAKEAYMKAHAATEIAQEAKYATEIIVGTQTGTTASWTGNASFPQLKDGMQILYWLPTTSASNATLNLTLSGGGTTGAIPCYYSGTTRIGTHYAAGNAIRLVYRENVTIGGTTIAKGFWADANYDSGNNYDRIRSYQSLTAVGAIAAGRIAVMNSSGKMMLLSTTAFDITGPVVYVGTAYTTSALTQTNNYICWGSAFSLANTKSGFTGTAGKAVYIVGTLDGKMLTPDSVVFTTTTPTAEDGKTYMLLGQMSTTTNAILYPEHPLFRFVHGKFQSLQEAAYDAYVSAETANDNIGDLANDVTKLGDETADNIAAAVKDLEDRILGEGGALAQSKDDLNAAIIAAREALEDQQTELAGMINTVNETYATSFAELYDFVRFVNTDTFKGAEFGPLAAEEGSEDAPRQIRVGQYNFTGTGWRNIVMLYESEESFGWWDGQDFHTGNIYVEMTERAVLGPITLQPRSDGTLMFLYTGGNS